MKKCKVPICPSCKAELKRVWETTYETYNFDGKAGRYSSDDFAGELTIKCPNCEADLRDIFAEGCCNYQAESEVKELK